MYKKRKAKDAVLRTTLLCELATNLHEQLCECRDPESDYDCHWSYEKGIKLWDKPTHANWMRKARMMISEAISVQELDNLCTTILKAVVNENPTRILKVGP